MTDPMDDLLARLAQPPTPPTRSEALMRYLHHEVPPEPDQPDALDQMRWQSQGQDRLLMQLFRKHDNQTN